MTYPNTHLHTTTYPNTHLHTTTYSNTHLHTTTYPNTHLHTTTYPNTHLQTMTYPNTHLHTTTYPNIHLHTSLCSHQYKQDRQCKCDVILKGVRVTIFGPGNAISIVFWVCVCSLSYVARKAHEPYYYYIFVCGLFGFTISFNIISLGVRFLKNKKLLNIKCLFSFSLQCLSETFRILRGIQRGVNINLQRC